MNEQQNQNPEQQINYYLSDFINKIRHALGEKYHRFLYPMADVLCSLSPLQKWLDTKLIHIAEGEKVLEIGSGYTLNAGKAGDAGMYICLDIDPYINQVSNKVLAFITKGSKIDNPSNMHTVTADAYYPPFQDGTFDLVISSKFVPRFDDDRNISSVFFKMFELLKPGGRIAVVERGIGPIPIIPLMVKKMFKEIGFNNIQMRPAVPGLYWNWYIFAEKPNTTSAS